MFSADLEEFSQQSYALIQSFIQDKEHLRALILKIPDEPTLFGLCEHYDILDKIILFANDSIRVRLHIFADGYFDRPHNHRWSYSSYILSGGYKHTIYRIKESENPQVEDLIPILVRQEKTGDFYTLHSSQYHSVVAQPNTVTLIARGPADKERFRLIDKTTNESWWQYGAATESAEDKRKKRMSHEQFQTAVAKLEKLGIL